MKKIYMLAGILLILYPAAVFSYPVTLYDFTGDDAEVLLEITGDGTSSIQFDVQVLNPSFADLRGVFFNFDPFPDNPGNLTVTGADVTGWQFDENIVDDLGNGALINPAGPFDAGIEIGLQGIGGGDDFYTTTFMVSYTDAIALGSYFGARLMSVGDYENDREGSSKLVGNVAPVPEPATMLLLGTGLVGLAGFSRRKVKA